VRTESSSSGRSSGPKSARGSKVSDACPLANLTPSRAHYGYAADRSRLDPGRGLLFQRAGVPEYWIVDLDARSVERWRPGDERPEVLTERLRWQPDTATPPLEIDLSAFFAQVVGD